MALSFSEMRKNRSNSLEKLNGELEKLNNKSSFNKDDQDYWQPTVDKAGNGYAVIRFLDTPKGEDAPFVRLYDHAFKGPGGKWYIEKCRSTIGEDDPVMEMNSKLWAQGEGSAGRDFVSGDSANNRPGSKRRTSYHSNIRVIEDPDNPENNGKTFKFKYGAKIFDKLNDAMNPKFKGEKQLNPFDLWEGANFLLKIRKVKGQRNYDSSGFDLTSQGPVDGLTDEQLEVLWEGQFSLAEIIAPDKFKSYDELQKHLNKVMDRTSVADTLTEDRPKAEARSAGRTQARREEPKEESAPWNDSSDNAEEDDESLAFFKKLT